jgi:hypothetical protein
MRYYVKASTSLNHAGRQWQALIDAVISSCSVPRPWAGARRLRVTFCISGRSANLVRSRIGLAFGPGGARWRAKDVSPHLEQRSELSGLKSAAARFFKANRRRMWRFVKG